MHYELTTTPSLTSHDVMIVGFLNDHPLPEIAQQIDKHHNGLASKLINKLLEPGDHLWQADINGHSLLLINCGDQSTYTAATLRKYLIDKITSILRHRMSSLLVCMPQLPQLTPNEQLQYMLLDIDATCYQLLEFKSKNNTPYALKTVQFYLPGADATTIINAAAIANSVSLTRNLANRPANRCTPTFLAEQAIQLAHDYPNVLHTKILEREDMQNIGMNALLAVSQGSIEPPKLIELHYNGCDKNLKPIILVGKGITFDSGGISIKSASKMEEMKFDMAGAASVFGVIKACAELKLPINVIGLLPCAENMPSGSAVKPGDIVTSLSGQTIEIINTDAEGRLILADTLTFAQRYNPKIIIDIATLTGAVIIALGGVASGLMSKDDELAQWLFEASVASQDKVWRLPLDDAYQTAIDSNLADMVNSTETSAAGSISAGCFLSRFTEQYRWAHLDVAGTAWISGKKNGATGRPVLLLIQFLRDLIAHAR